MLGGGTLTGLVADPARGQGQFPDAGKYSQILILHVRIYAILQYAGLPRLIYLAAAAAAAAAATTTTTTQATTILLS